MGSNLSAESGKPLSQNPSFSASRSFRKRKSLKENSRSGSFSFGNSRDESLQRIPMFLNGSSEVASLFSKQGMKGPNQDAMIIWENFASSADSVFCGVFDGHGPYGHMVAKRVRDLLPLKLSSYLEANTSLEKVSRKSNLNAVDENNPETGEKEPRISINNAEKRPVSIKKTLKQSLLKAFKSVDRDLKMQRSINCFCSGTTAVTLVKQGGFLAIGNIGDSRAVLGTTNADNTLVAVQLTVDLKANVPAEAERIRKRKGRVFALRDEPEVARIWLPYQNSPGLAMTRAFGDFCLKDFGFISVPEICYRRLNEKDKFIVLATDGIWDVLTNDEVVRIIKSSPTRSSAARFLVESAIRAWILKFPISRVDDCAVVILFLDSKPDNISTAFNSKNKKRKKNASDTEIRSEGIEKDKLCESGSEWSALEGVARVNTLLNLPGF